MTLTELTPAQKTLTQASAELAGLAECLRLEVEEEGGEEMDLRMLLSQSLRRISKRLWNLVEEVQ